MTNLIVAICSWAFLIGWFGQPFFYEEFFPPYGHDNFWIAVIAYATLSGVIAYGFIPIALAALFNWFNDE
jgi:hypothetical protein